MHKLNLLYLNERFAICRLAPQAPLPAWALSATFVSITRTADELSIVCPQALVPADMHCERGWRCVRVAGRMDFAMIGVAASLVNPLAQAGISVFVVSTFDTDYLLVKENDWPRAVSALQDAGHIMASAPSR